MTKLILIITTLLTLNVFSQEYDEGYEGEGEGDQAYYDEEISNAEKILVQALQAEL